MAHAEEGGWGEWEGVFGRVAGVYRVVAEETVLGEERTGGEEGEDCGGCGGGGGGGDEGEEEKGGWVICWVSI